MSSGYRPAYPIPVQRPVSAVVALTLLEMLVCVSIIAFLFAMLVPSLMLAREQGRRVQCAGNLSHWGRATMYYREEHNDYIPTEGNQNATDREYTWYNVLPPYLHAPSYQDVEGAGKEIRDFPELHMWICPSKNRSKVYKSGSGKNQFHYGMNAVLDGVGVSTPSPYVPGFMDEGKLPLRARRFHKKPSTVFMFDIYPNQPMGMQLDTGTSYHQDFANVLYLDTGVRNFKAADFVEQGDYKAKKPIWNDPRLYWGWQPPVP